MKQYCGQSLHVLNGMLKCTCCHKLLSIKGSTVNRHVESDAHKKALLEASKNQLTMLSFKEVVIQNEKSGAAPAGRTLPLDTLAYRMAICHTFLITATLFSNLRHPSNELRSRLEDGHCALPLNAITDCIPSLNDRERNLTIDEMNKAKKISFASDGTRMMCDIDGIVSVTFYCEQILFVIILNFILE